MFGLRLVTRIPGILRPAARRQFSTTIATRGGAPWKYRCPPNDPAPEIENLATAAMAFTWWWILYGCFTEPHHLFGPGGYPDPDKWTDAELGIPPDDYEE